jgi:hypothetical protein
MVVERFINIVGVIRITLTTNRISNKKKDFARLQLSF